MDFHSSVYRKIFLETGTAVSVRPRRVLREAKFFVLYTLNDADKIVHLEAMTWPPGEEISQYPRLWGSDNQGAEFMAYTCAFSPGEGETFPTFHTDVVNLPRYPIFHGQKSVVEFYCKMFSKVKESLR